MCVTLDSILLRFSVLSIVRSLPVLQHEHSFIYSFLLTLMRLSCPVFCLLIWLTTMFGRSIVSPYITIITMQIIFIAKPEKTMIAFVVCLELVIEPNFLITRFSVYLSVVQHQSIGLVRHNYSFLSSAMTACMYHTPV